MDSKPRDGAGPDRTPVRVYRLGEEPGDDLTPVTTAAERLAMVWGLSSRMWELSGRGRPAYTRATMPIVVQRLHERRLV